MNESLKKTSLSNKLFLCLAPLAVGIMGEPTVRAQPGGVPLWMNHYNTPGTQASFASAMAADGSGNVFVTGFSSFSYGADVIYDYATIAYSGAGVPLWASRYGLGLNSYATAVAVDAGGNVFVTGSSDGDYATIKYSNAGVPVWTNRYGLAYHVQATGVAVDAGGNVFVTGSSGTIKHSGDGVPVWTNSGSGAALAVDHSGNVFVTGSFAGDHATIKYSGAGVPLWANCYGGQYDAATAVAVDASGNVIVTGHSGGDYATIKYSNAGVPLWTNRYYNGGATAVAVDRSGNVFVTGSSSPSPSGDGSDYVTIKYSSAGIPLWTNRFQGPYYLYNYAIAMAVDGSGNVFVTGYSYYASSNCFAVVAYSNAGAVLWTNTCGGYGLDGGAAAVAVDQSGNVFVTGNWGGSIVTTKYSRAGPLLTIARTATNTLAVSWPSPAADFTLQQNTNVATTNWVLVGTTPADNGTNKTVIFDPPDGSRFYRLFRP